ncbi:MAG TPA: T9SS type A sorting domain-containing protein [Candidatus Acidoferrales bacterium]|nr:T9SS type A sorting domain-containing protein [Candidatus Acidoferrales bacterium]
MKLNKLCLEMALIAFFQLNFICIESVFAQQDVSVKITQSTLNEAINTMVETRSVNIGDYHHTWWSHGWFLNLDAGSITIGSNNSASISATIVVTNEEPLDFINNTSTHFSVTIYGNFQLQQSGNGYKLFFDPTDVENASSWGDFSFLTNAFIIPGVQLIVSLIGPIELNSGTKLLPSAITSYFTSTIPTLTTVVDPNNPSNSYVQFYYTIAGNKLITIQNNVGGDVSIGNVKVLENGTWNTPLSPYSDWFSPNSSLSFGTSSTAINYSGQNWRLYQWDDQTSASQRTVTIHGDQTFTATFEPAQAVTIQTSLEGAITSASNSLTFLGQTVSSPYSDYAFMPPYRAPISAINPLSLNGNTWSFYNWSDGVTSASRTISLSSPSTLSANYKGHLVSSISTATMGDGCKIAIDNYDVRYAVYASLGSIWFTKTNGSGGWTNEVKLGDGINPAIAVAVQPGGGTYVYVVWEHEEAQGSNNYWMVYSSRSTDGGTTWSTPVNLSGSTPLASLDPQHSSPVIAADQISGNVVVLWSEGGNNFAAQTNPGTGSAPAIFADNSLGTNPQFPSIVCCAEGVYYAAYSTGGSSIRFISLSTPPTSGGMFNGWSAPVVVPNSSSSTTPCIAYEADDDAIGIAWANTSNHTVYYSESTDDGVNWSTTQFTHGSDYLSSPTLMFYTNSNEREILLFQMGSHIGECVRPINSLGSWTQVINLGTGTGPSLPALDPNFGEITFPIATWTTGSAAPYSINFSKFESFSGTISSDTIWSGSVNVSGTVTVNSGVKLTISSGTEVTFASGAGLTVNGTLNAVGTSSSPIMLDRSSSSGTWNGITFNSGSYGTLSYDSIQHATTAVNCSGSLPSINYCTILNNTTGISVSLNGVNGHNLIAHNTIQNNSSYGIAAYRSTFYMDTNKITSNGSSGVYCYNSPSSSYAPILVGNTMSGNPCGLNCYQCPAYLAYVDSNHNGYPLQGHNTLMNCSSCGISAGYGSSVFLGQNSSYGGYNSFKQNPSCDISAVYDGTIWAQINWWNNISPKVSATGTTVYSNYPLTGSDPNASLNSSSSKATPGNLISGNMQQKSPNGVKSVTQGADSSTTDDALGQLLVLGFQGKYDEAIAGYEVIFSQEGNTVRGRYALRKLDECFRSLNRKEQFNAYLNSTVAPLTTPKSDLQALLIEFENETLFDNGNYNAMATNLQGILRDFKGNKETYKHALFDLGFLYLNSLHEVSKAKICFAQLQDAYPNDDLLQFAKYLLNSCDTSQAAASSAVADSSAIISQQMQAGLMSNYPNPFNPTTRIPYNLSKSGHVTLKIYDILGREVATLVNENQEIGIHFANFDGSRLASGVYFYRLTAPGISQVKKMLLTK